MKRWWAVGALVALALVGVACWFLARPERVESAPHGAQRVEPPTSEAQGAAGKQHSAVSLPSPSGLAPTVHGIDAVAVIQFRETPSRPMGEREELARRSTWAELEKFMRVARLTDEHRHRFLADLYAASKKYGQLLDDDAAGRLDPAQRAELREGLDDELKDTLATYLDEEQLRLFGTFIPGGMLFMVTVGDVLVDAEHPDAKGWTLDGDDVTEEDIYQGRPPPRG